MFPTAGYFKGIDCPFYKEDLCYRPYCHYKHAKRKVQSSSRHSIRFPHVSGKCQVSADAGHEQILQQSSSGDVQEGGSIAQNSPLVSVFEKPTNVCFEKEDITNTTDAGSREADKASILEKQFVDESNNTAQLSYVPPELLTTEGSIVVSDLTQSQGGAESTATTNVSTMVSDLSMIDGKAATSYVSMQDDGVSPAQSKVEGHECPAMISEPSRDIKHTCAVAGVVKDEVTDMSCNKLDSDDATVASYPSLSIDSDKECKSNELVLLPEVAGEGKMIVDLFGSSGEDDSTGGDDIEVAAGDSDSDEDGGFAVYEIQQRKTEEDFKRITSQSADVSRSSAAKGSYENLGIKNRRQAHSNAELMGHGVTVGKPKKKTTSIVNPLLSDSSAIYTGKKRKAHHQADAGPDVTVAPAPKRPRLLVSVNARISTSLRQNFLDNFIDEYLKFCDSEAEAYKKGLDDEQSLFNKANNKMLYMNLSSIALKRLRERASKEQPCTSKKAKSTTHSSTRQHSVSAVSPGTSKKTVVHRKKQAMKADDTKSPIGTYYLDEIFKTSVKMELHQKTISPSCVDHEEPTGSSQTCIDSTVSRKDHQRSPKEGRNVSKAKGQLSFDSTLQKMDRKLQIKRGNPRSISPTLKKQLNSGKVASGQLVKVVEGVMDVVKSSPDKVSVSKPASSQVQKLIDKGFAKMKPKREVAHLTCPTNKLCLVSKKSSKPSSSASADTTGHEQGKGKGIRQISVVTSKSSSLPSSVTEAVSNTATYTNSAISATKFYSSKPGKITINIKSNSIPAAPVPSKTEKHSMSSPNYSILKKKEVVLTNAIFIQYMHSYLLTEEQLIENGYPRSTGEPGVASIVRKPDDVSDIKPVGPNAQRHTCCRCGKLFIIYNSGSYQSTEECCYHNKRLQKKREYGEGVISYYPCCQGVRGSSGCQIAKLHVTKGAKPPLESGYVQTGGHPNVKDYSSTVYALDCEMCYTTAGLELTRVSVVGINKESVYESLVKPDFPVVDYNTKYSGITAQDLLTVTTRLQDVQRDLLNLFYEDTILLGHSLESDLQSLKIIHSCVVDTALVFPHRMGLPYKRALRNVTAEFLHKIIQDEVDGGHDSKEDAIACMDLMKWKIKSDLQKTTRRGSVT